MTEETPTRPGLPSRKPPVRAMPVSPGPAEITTSYPSLDALQARIGELERENRKLRDMLRDPRMRMPR